MPPREFLPGTPASPAATQSMPVASVPAAPVAAPAVAKSAVSDPFAGALPQWNLVPQQTFIRRIR